MANVPEPELGVRILVQPRVRLGGRPVFISGGKLLAARGWDRVDVTGKGGLVAYALP